MLENINYAVFWILSTRRRNPTSNAAPRATGPLRPRFGPRCDGSRTLTLIQVIDARRPRASDSLAGIGCAGGSARCFTAALRSSSTARSFAAWRGARESLLRMRGEAFLAQGGTLCVLAPRQRASAARTAVKRRRVRYWPKTMHVGAVRAKKWGAQPVGGACGPIGVSRTAGLQSDDFLTTLGPPPFQGRAAPDPQRTANGEEELPQKARGCMEAQLPLSGSAA